MSPSLYYLLSLSVSLLVDHENNLQGILCGSAHRFSVSLSLQNTIQDPVYWLPLPCVSMKGAVRNGGSRSGLVLRHLLCSPLLSSFPVACRLLPAFPADTVGPGWGCPILCGAHVFISLAIQCEGKHRETCPPPIEEYLAYLLLEGL